MSDGLRALYEEVILDHNRRPRHYGRIPPGANRRAEGFNPLCGDQITLHLAVEDGVIRDVGFEGKGCAISKASASLMVESLIGKTEREAEAFFRGMHALLTGEGEPLPYAALGKLAVLAGVRDYPARVKCATLAWHTLQSALENRAEPVTTE
jgi:nitrogen fixation NifU-like protein